MRNKLSEGQELRAEPPRLANVALGLLCKTARATKSGRLVQEKSMELLGPEKHLCTKKKKRKGKKMSQEREGAGEGAATEHYSGQPEVRMGPREKFSSA